MFYFDERRTSDDDVLFRQVLTAFPASPDIWLIAIDKLGKYAPGYLRQLFGELATQNIRLDREVLSKACKVSPRIVQNIGQPLQQDITFLRHLLTVRPQTLLAFPHILQQQFPDLFEDHLEDALRDLQEIIAFLRTSLHLQLIAPTFWSSRRVVKTWFKLGYPYNERYHSVFKGDRELVLLMVKERDLYSEGFSMFQTFAGPLCKDKTFMMKVVAINADLYGAADVPLTRSHDLALVAFGSKHRAFPPKYPVDYEGNPITTNIDVEFLENDFSRWIEAALQLHKTFLSTVLFGLSSCPGSESAPLSLLKKDEETVLAFKRTFTAYLDIPTDEQLKMIQIASANIARFSAQRHGRHR